MTRRRDETGFSLLEMSITVALIVLLAAFVTNLSSRDSAGEIVIRDAARRLRLRRAEALRLSAGLGADAVERTGWQPRVTIDFADPSTTAALRTGSCTDSTATQPRCTTGTLSSSCYCLNADGDPAPADAWIAATALHLGVPLITHNKNDYLGVDGLTIISESGS